MRAEGEIALGILRKIRSGDMYLKLYASRGDFCVDGWVSGLSVEEIELLRGLGWPTDTRTPTRSTEPRGDTQQ